MDVVLIATLIGLSISLLGWYNQWQQTSLLRQQLNEAKGLEKEIGDWYVKHGEAIANLKKIYPSYVGGSPLINGLGLVFSDTELRSRIETYLGSQNRMTGHFEPSTISRDQLLNPVVQRTIADGLNLVEHFKQDNPEWAEQMKL